MDVMSEEHHKKVNFLAKCDLTLSRQAPITTGEDNKFLI
jgi:hypothetical protein